MLRLRSALTPFIVTTVFASCSERLGPADVAGSYVLEMVNQVPVPLQGLNVLISGSITLTVTGEAERRVSYRVDTLGTVREFVATGTFRLEGSDLRLALHEGTSVWTPAATLIGTSITLTYPNPADGPDIAERYLRP
jgi:hypothetical protein